MTNRAPLFGRDDAKFDGALSYTRVVVRALTTAKLTSFGAGKTVSKLGRSLPDQEAIREAVGQASERMFNLSARSAAVEKLRESLKEHKVLREQVEQSSVELFERRLRVVATVVEPVEEYINGLANTPKEFDKSVRVLRIEIDRFGSTVRRIEMEAAEAKRIGSSVGLAGATAGIGLAAFGPSAALAVATTFGTASTGAAISALSGAAATNAALAWLGGGAVAAGGGGMAVGNALLALAGPVGWTVGGLALVGSGTYLHYRNGVLAQKAVEKRVRVEGEIRALRTAKGEIERLGASTRTYTEGTLASLGWLCDKAPKDYRHFDPGHKERLGALINHIRSLSELIRREVVL